eukprot:1183508-Pleurochrysis_carterae.AAC.1
MKRRLLVLAVAAAAAAVPAVATLLTARTGRLHGRGRELRTRCSRTSCHCQSYPKSLRSAISSACIASPITACTFLNHQVST